MKKNNPHLSNSLRIIGGKWRGRRLSFPSVPDLRPTPDRVRETLFNWISHDIAEARCLDVFCGSGALSMEALSRGAVEVWALEKNKIVSEALSKQVADIAANALKIFNVDSLQWLQKPASTTFDIVFLDPPYAAALLSQCLLLLIERKWVKDEGSIYFENANLLLETEVPAPWKIVKQKKAGAMWYGLIKRQEALPSEIKESEL